MLPNLTAGSINRILEGEEVTGAIMQILGCKKIPDSENDHYRLLISDGVTECPFAMLGTQLHNMVTNKELEKYTIVRLEKYICNKIQPDRKVIILLKFVVLVPGAEVGEKIGNPVSILSSSSTTDANTTKNNAESKAVSPNASLNLYRIKSTAKASVTTKTLVKSRSNAQVMLPNLTAGSIKRILEGEEVTGAVIQILGCKKMLGSGSDRYQLLISDGIVGCPYAFLSFHLNNMITNKEIEKYTIVRLDKCVCDILQRGRKFILLFDLIILVPGAEVGEIIGNPVSSSLLSTSTAAENTPVNNSVFNTAPKNVVIPQINGSIQVVCPIANLSPYQNNKWIIKARVISKTPVRTWRCSCGERKLFSIILLDESGEIQATGFNDVVDKFYELFELNNVYHIGPATLKTVNTIYSIVNNDYEMTFNSDTTIVPCEGSSSSISVLQYDFVPIANIKNIEKKSYIDIIGVSNFISEIQTFVAHTTNKEITKRNVTIVDQSNKEIKLILWGNDALKFNGNKNPVIAVKRAKVSDFNGRSLVITVFSSIQINPDIQEAHLLKSWFDREGCNLQSESLSSKI